MRSHEHNDHVPVSLSHVMVTQARAILLSAAGRNVTLDTGVLFAYEPASLSTEHEFQISDNVLKNKLI